MVVRKTRVDRLLSDDLANKLKSEDFTSAGDLYTAVKRDSSQLFDLVEDALVDEESSAKGVKKKGSLGGVVYALLISVFIIALLGLGYIAYSFITTMG
jgi:hypothetical protein